MSVYPFISNLSFKLTSISTWVFSVCGHGSPAIESQGQRSRSEVQVRGQGLRSVSSTYERGDAVTRLSNAHSFTQPTMSKLWRKFRALEWRALLPLSQYGLRGC